ncbi:hypothetical protein Tsubulata_012023 [Turnera subulata]|uniref:Uncharacterized protein n=1 Tax=Turnera subulata TaxID=218843 RepID=A0A9Q0FBC2_9ROSI|nr:hypothetical protein Tsubulata_012023 [Turnera subulata]
MLLMAPPEREYCNSGFSAPTSYTIALAPSLQVVGSLLDFTRQYRRLVCSMAVDCRFRASRTGMDDLRCCHAVDDLACM